MQKEGKTYSIHLLSKDGKSTVEPPPMSEIVLPPLHSNSKRRMYLPDALPRARTLQSMCTAGATTTATAYDDDDNSAKAASPLLRRLPPAERNDDHAPPEESPGDGALTAEEAAKPVPSSPSLLVSCSDGSGSSVSPPLRRTGRSSSLPQIGPILLRQDSLHVEKKLERRGSILSMLAGGLVWKSQSSLSSEEDDGQASSSEGSSAGSVGSNDPRGPANDESIRMVCEYALFNVPVDLSKPLHARSPSMGPLSPMLHGSGGGRRMQQEVPPGAEEPICLPLCDCDLDHVPVEEIELVAWMKAMYKDIFHRRCVFALFS